MPGGLRLRCPNAARMQRWLAGWRGERWLIGWLLGGLAASRRFKLLAGGLACWLVAAWLLPSSVAVTVAVRCVAV